MSTNPPRARESRFGRRHPASPPPTPAAETDAATTSTATEAGPRHRQLGQVLPIFAVMSIVLLGGTALLSDVGWWWTNQQHMQRAADAGALAGAIYLPGNQGRAFSSAVAEVAKNGYVDGEAGVVVKPRRDPGDPRKLLVDIDGPVKTNFAGVFCWQDGPCLRSVDVSVTGAASYVLPVPMGSPENYYGVGFFQGVIPGTATARVLDVPDPTGGTLATQGFWGAIFTAGGVRENGDRYAPVYIGANNPPDGTNGGPNPDYDAGGHDYTIEVGDGGQVRLFDPIFCATGRNLSGGWFGAGDHWTTDGTGGGETVGPVAVRFTLFDTNGTPYVEGDDTATGSTLEYDPGTSTLGDFSGNFHQPGSPPQNNGRADAVDCSADRRPQPVGAPERLGRPAGRHLSPERQHEPGPERVSRRREPLLDLGQRLGAGPRLRWGPHGRLYQPRRHRRGRQAEVLLLADRSGARRQDDGDHALRSG